MIKFSEVRNAAEARTILKLGAVLLNILRSEQQLDLVKQKIRHMGTVNCNRCHCGVIVLSNDCQN